MRSTFARLEKQRLFQEDLRRKNKIRDRFKRARLHAATPAQVALYKILETLGKEYQFKVVKEREIYTKTGVRFADLYIQKYGLIVEVDGGYHLTPDQKEKDQRRDNEIWEKKQVITLRFSNDDVWSKKEVVIETTRSIIERLKILPNHRSQGRGEKKHQSTLARKLIYEELQNQYLPSAQDASIH